MNLASTHAAILILKYHGVPACIVGEIALNYYNVPRVCHDLEICVPESRSVVAASLLCYTGLFEPFPNDSESNNYTEYKRGFPRVRTTLRTKPPQAITIFPAALFDLGPIEKHLVRFADCKVHISKEMSHLDPVDIAALPLPRLAPLLRGLAKRYLDTQDDVAMIAVEQLVDGMNLDEAWVERNLKDSDAALLGLVANHIHGKQSRIDYYSDNTITCFISGPEEAESVRTGRLNDAAITLHGILSRQGIDFGIFGGYAIGTMGGAHESKDIDCLASVTKEQIISLLDNEEGFQAISQSRQDYVAFLWSDRADRSHAVLVEIFCEQFPGAQYSMMDVPRTAIPIQGLSLGQGSSFFLDPFYLFKGKLRAAATRGKFHDSADLRMLGGKYKADIESRAHELNVQYLGLALKRYPELERLFQQLGIDVEQAKHATKDLDLNKLPPPTSGDVQRGLLE
ncbi:ser/Thr protein phosphatase [Dactylonectria estremocensis]|uniref:Ser/Thr protein phosphatase n=1 Tax=Dactylonectria estremocensis TaxID=1079267 RepID=A0A9P9IG30_9HYPO|nr:ser/Thr protein phosphatase [Dactylonectria estremocensis]